MKMNKSLSSQILSSKKLARTEIIICSVILILISGLLFGLYGQSDLAENAPASIEDNIQAN
jgi:hypothetical protein